MDTSRAVWRTQKHRAEDLVVGDVIRNRFGKWDIVCAREKSDGRYVSVTTECGGEQLLRTVQLVDVQVAKPS